MSDSKQTAEPRAWTGTVLHECEEVGEAACLACDIGRRLSAEEPRKQPAEQPGGAHDAPAEEPRTVEPDEDWPDHGPGDVEHIRGRTPESWLARGRDEDCDWSDVFTLLARIDVLEATAKHAADFVRQGTTAMARVDAGRREGEAWGILRITHPHIWDVDGHVRGTVHELELDHGVLAVREYTIDGSGVRGADVTPEVSMPFLDAVHILLNLTEEERRAFGAGRTQPPEGDVEVICRRCGLALVVLPVIVPAHLSHTGKAHAKNAPIDACIADQVRALNEAGRLTASCCCGHGDGPGSIVLHDGTEIKPEPPRRANEPEGDTDG